MHHPLFALEIRGGFRSPIPCHQVHIFHLFIPMIGGSQSCVQVDNKLSKFNSIFNSHSSDLHYYCSLASSIWYVNRNKKKYIYNNRLTLGLIGNNVQHAFLTIDKPLLHQELPTTTNLSSLDHVIRRWNWFNANWRNTRYCSLPTTARDRAMLNPCELGAYTRISLRWIKIGRAHV